MAGRRILYLAVLALCTVFYIAYGQWLAWLILLTVLALPWFSLVLSLPAMLRFRAEPSGPLTLRMGEAGELWLLGSCSLPMPPFQGKLRLKNLLTGESWYYQEREDLPTDHCGGIAMTAERVKIYDYLGLFALPVRGRTKKTILIRPREVKMLLGSSPANYIPRAWKPKFGGGTGENHELRLYRPGDSLNQIHWKLSAKTGKLILREPMEPIQGRLLLTLNLRGTPEELDRMLGRLLWLGKHLLEQQLRFELRALTAEGLLIFPVAGEAQLQKALDTLLCSGIAPKGDLREQEYAAAWRCHIGGDADEAG